MASDSVALSQQNFSDKSLFGWHDKLFRKNDEVVDVDSLPVAGVLGIKYPRILESPTSSRFFLNERDGRQLVLKTFADSILLLLSGSR